MSFDSMANFFNMGGYGFYIWLSYGFTALLLIILTLNSKAKHRQLIKQIQQRFKREIKLKKVAQQSTQDATSAPAKQGK